MVEERAQRRLAAILAADVVGYSRLMEQDEAGTFERLRAYRKELIEPEVAQHQGRVFKLMGDGLLAEFASVVEAVECAAVVQRAMAERNAGLAEDRRIDLRIGINLGDVIVEGDDRYGDGVNIAARLQQLAELATNSAKYGSLSVASGTLDVSCNAHGDEVVVTWTERGGPPIMAPAMLEGFGSKLVHRSMAAQLGGAIAFDWSEEGVVATLRMSKDRIAK